LTHEIAGYLQEVIRQMRSNSKIIYTIEPLKLAMALFEYDPDLKGLSVKDMTDYVCEWQNAQRPK
jgi:hypothetical protein